jgi:3-(methylsulfanyl)propanoyl-CoA dehydrogenase
MGSYQAPLRDMRFQFRALGAIAKLQRLPAHEDLTDDLVEAVLGAAARWSEQQLAPLAQLADRRGTELVAGQVRVPAEIRAAYREFVAGGWSALTASPTVGGQGLPQLLGTAVAETWKSANLAFSLCPMLTQGAVDALERHASAELKALLLPKMVSGEWTGAMNLTEPQAGSDLAAVQTRARRDGGLYRIAGRKIFITWGDHDMSENIVHLVLARSPDAPGGVKGISLFAVPKFLINGDGSPGELNDLTTVSVEHKLGIRGSPTCVLNYGEREGAIGYLVGTENDGLHCMFTMMNRARLAVGVEGLAVAERAYQAALAYARERVQGRAPGYEENTSIFHHPDVRRMLMTMKASIDAMRALAYYCALNVDLAEGAGAERERREAFDRVAVLTPVVKGWCTEVGQALASLGLQVHGGVGYIEETGVAQWLRDVRITTIYEGTTGIQANDLVGRKLIADGGAAVGALLGEIKTFLCATEFGADLLPVAIRTALDAALGCAYRAVEYVLREHRADPNLPGAAGVNLLMLMGTLLGGWQLAIAARHAISERAGNAQDPEWFLSAKPVTALFYAQHVLPRAHSYLSAIMAGSASVMGLAEQQFER